MRFFMMKNNKNPNKNITPPQEYSSTSTGTVLVLVLAQRLDAFTILNQQLILKEACARREHHLFSQLPSSSNK